MRPAANAVNEAVIRNTKPNTDMLVSVSAIIPEDANALERFVNETLRVLEAHYVYYELLLIDNASPWDVHIRVRNLQAQVPNVRLVRLSRRYSTEIALAAALDHCIGDYVVMIDPLAHPAAVIPTLVSAAVDGCDSVTAVSSDHRDTFLDRAVCGPVYSMASRIFGFRLKPNESTYKVFSRRLVNSIVRIRSKDRYLSYLNASVGLQQRTISYESTGVSERRSAARRMFQQLGMLSNMLVSNSAIPLRFASLLGVAASVINVLYLTYILIVTLVKSRIAEGWLTLSLTNTTMFLLLFLILTILSGYIARILDEAKEQPLYFVESESNSKVSSTDRDRLNIV